MVSASSSLDSDPFLKKRSLLFWKMRRQETKQIAAEIFQAIAGLNMQQVKQTGNTRFFETHIMSMVASR